MLRRLGSLGGLFLSLGIREEAEGDPEIIRNGRPDKPHGTGANGEGPWRKTGQRGGLP